MKNNIIKKILLNQPTYNNLIIAYMKTGAILFIRDITDSFTCYYFIILATLHGPLAVERPNNEDVMYKLAFALHTIAEWVHNQISTTRLMLLGHSLGCKIMTKSGCIWRSPCRARWVFLALQYLLANMSIAKPFRYRDRFKVVDGKWARSVSERIEGSTGSPSPRYTSSLIWTWTVRAPCELPPLQTPSSSAPRSLRSRRLW